jgi:hypothetical protein
MGGSYGLALSGSSSATSGAHGDVFGDNVAGGLNLPKWFLPLVVGAVALVSIVFLVRR